MKVLALGSMLFSMFIFTSCAQLSGKKACCKKEAKHECCYDKCGSCDGKSSCADGKCDNPAKKA